MQPQGEFLSLFLKMRDTAMCLHADKNGPREKQKCDEGDSYMKLYPVHPELSATRSGGKAQQEINTSTQPFMGYRIPLTMWTQGLISSPLRVGFCRTLTHPSHILYSRSCEVSWVSLHVSLSSKTALISFLCVSPASPDTNTQRACNKCFPECW